MLIAGERARQALDRLEAAIRDDAPRHEIDRLAEVADWWWDRFTAQFLAYGRMCERARSDG